MYLYPLTGWVTEIPGKPQLGTQVYSLPHEWLIVVFLLIFKTLNVVYFIFGLYELILLL